jgi:CDP-diacylglycerol--glycerol-3-phosphate 3-phosphatidyltransferase
VFSINSMYHLAGMTFTELSGMNSDFWFALGLLTLAGLVAGAYSIRVLLKGRAHAERIERQGSSNLLSKDVMQGGYWFFQVLGRGLVFFKITPNMVSWSSLFFGFVAAVCLALGHFGSAAVFGTISAVLDALDGMVARLTGKSSDAGEVLDAAVDRYVEFFMLAGLVIYYREIPVFMLLAFAALIGSFMVSYSSAKAEAMHVDPPKGNMRRPERCLYLMLGAALSPVTIPWLERVREFPMPIAHPMIVAMGLIGVLANVSAVERLWAIAKAVRAREADVVAARSRVAQTELVEAFGVEVDPSFDAHSEAHDDDGHHHEPVTR